MKLLFCKFGFAYFYGSQFSKKRPETASHANVKYNGSKDKKPNIKCVVSKCKEKHPIFKCPKVKKMEILDRKKLVAQHSLCELCLNTGHAIDMCTKLERLGTS